MSSILPNDVFTTTTTTTRNNNNNNFECMLDRTCYEFLLLFAAHNHL